MSEPQESIEFECCPGTQIPYPEVGNNTECPVCHSVFAATKKRSEGMKTDLNAASNLFGPLSGEVRAHLIRMINNPSEENWDNAHGLILRAAAPQITLWQAVCAVDPSYASVRGPVSRWVEDSSELGGHSEPVTGWARVPSPETITQAINYATR